MNSKLDEIIALGGYVEVTGRDIPVCLPNSDKTLSLVFLAEKTQLRIRVVDNQVGVHGDIINAVEPITYSASAEELGVSGIEDFLIGHMGGKFDEYKCAIDPAELNGQAFVTKKSILEIAIA